MDNNRYIPDMVETFSDVENCRLNMVLKLSKPLTSHLYDFA